MTRRTRVCWVLWVGGAALLSGCQRSDPNRVQGYIEGEFVYVASPRSGTLQALSVARGAQVKEGDALFALDPEPERTARDEAARRLSEGEAELADARKGVRPSELASLESQLADAQEALAQANRDYERMSSAANSSAATQQELDRARSLRDRSKMQASKLDADLTTARLGARPDRVVADEENVRALQATLAKAEWDLAQKTQKAPKTGEVFDTLYREGEWVDIAKPVVAILPPANVRARVFVAEERIGSVHAGDRVAVIVDGVPGETPATVSFVSPKAEYTPPVIYSRESRSKLVFMVEAEFAAADAAKLHPGQPVEVRLSE